MGGCIHVPTTRQDIVSGWGCNAHKRIYPHCPHPHHLPLQQASTLSRDLRLPRIYISANSGARIGLAEELKHLYKVAWEDEEAPDRGFRYLDLSPADYIKVQAHCYAISAGVIATVSALVPTLSWCDSYCLSTGTMYPHSAGVIATVSALVPTLSWCDSYCLSTGTHTVMCI